MIVFFKVGPSWVGDGDSLVNDFKNACGFVCSASRATEIQKYLAAKFNEAVEVHGRRTW